MATHLQNKISVDVAANKGSANSLSFAGLICIQDQQSKLPPIIKEDDPEFEFSHTRPHLTDLMISWSPMAGMNLRPEAHHWQLVAAAGDHVA